ncbi:MAG: AbrB/MazE/SpoVT family DNA-binding domain-containing protein [Thermomicrobiales bacterium]|jgi:AbrB family looped-hinge helix DNA binding protein|nr:AbrB/MazE/SpoVT family DNA-binding domain-containing protein [Thermomicrobiales bacterium]
MYGILMVLCQRQRIMAESGKVAMETVAVRVSEGGRIVIPAEYRRALGLQVGDEILLQLDDHELRLFTRRQAIRRVQEMLRGTLPPGRSPSEELIAERRAEAARE